MEIPVKCTTCGHEWAYTGQKHPKTDPTYRILCASCHSSIPLEAAVVDTATIPDPEPRTLPDPLTERIEEIEATTIFTKRQAEVIAFLEAGYAEGEIAQRLDLTSEMIGRHENNIEAKIEQANSTLSFVAESEVLDGGETTADDRTSAPTITGSES